MTTHPDPAPKCTLCGEAMPEGEEMFNYHGYSGPCPKPPLAHPDDALEITDLAESIACQTNAEREALNAVCDKARAYDTLMKDVAAGTWRIVPGEPEGGLLKNMRDFALSVKISSSYGWIDYMRDLHKIMIEAAQKYRKDSLTTEPVSNPYKLPSGNKSPESAVKSGNVRDRELIRRIDYNARYIDDELPRGTDWPVTHYVEDGLRRSDLEKIIGILEAQSPISGAAGEPRDDTQGRGKGE